MSAKVRVLAIIGGEVSTSSCYELPTTSTFDFEPEALGADDLDGDGDVDLVYACCGFNAVFINSGGAQGGTEGTFEQAGVDDVVAGTVVIGRQDLAHMQGELSDPEIGGCSVSLSLTDLDGDGDIDIVMANADFKDNSYPNFVFINTGGAQADKCTECTEGHFIHITVGAVATGSRPLWVITLYKDFVYQIGRLVRIVVCVDRRPCNHCVVVSHDIDGDGDNGARSVL
jgi:hypothetical protein